MSDWLTVLSEAAQSEWEQGRALNIAQIPNIFKAHDLDYRTFLSGRGLREALSLSAGEKLKLLQNPDDALVWGVVPRDVDLDRASIPSLFKRSSLEERMPRFKRSFWTAFIKRMMEGERRFVLKDGLFIHLPKDKIPDLSWKEILPDDIVDADTLDKDGFDKVVLSKIKDWCMRHGLSVSDFYIGATDRQFDTPHRDERNFSIDFSSLSEQDLARIVIPLDIALKLFRR